MRNSVKPTNLLDTEHVSVADKLERNRIAAEISACLSKQSAPLGPNGKKPIAIEVDGPSHFYIHSTNYTAYTKLKHRILSKMGYQVVHIPYFEWNELDNPSKKEKYVIDKITGKASEVLDDPRV
jgi:hypothetical protein